MIVVYGIKEKLNPIKTKLSDVIHECIQSVLGMPEDKRAHRFIPMKKEDFYYPGGRTDCVYCHRNKYDGRSEDRDTKAPHQNALQRNRKSIIHFSDRY